MPAYTARFLMNNLLIKIFSCEEHNVQFTRISGNHKVHFLMPAPPKSHWPERKSSIADLSTSTQDQMPLKNVKRRDMIKCQWKMSKRRELASTLSYDFEQREKRPSIFQVHRKDDNASSTFLEIRSCIGSCREEAKFCQFHHKHERKTSYIAWWHKYVCWKGVLPLSMATQILILLLSHTRKYTYHQREGSAN